MRGGRGPDGTTGARLKRAKVFWFFFQKRTASRFEIKLALASGAGILVSSDEDLLVLHPWRGVPVLRPAKYFGQALT
jgi:hypothetical protein